MTLTPSIYCPRADRHGGGLAAIGVITACPARDAAVSARQRPAGVSGAFPRRPARVRPVRAPLRHGQVSWSGYWQVSAKMYLRCTSGQYSAESGYQGLRRLLGPRPPVPGNMRGAAGNRRTLGNPVLDPC
jgi:hypothetical protein